MAGGCSTAGTHRVRGWLYLADVATSSQPEDTGAGMLSALVLALCRARNTGTRLQSGIRPCLALAPHRGERYCRGAPSSAQRLCGHRALDASSPCSNPEDAWRAGWGGLVVAHRADAVGARTWLGHDWRGSYGQRYSGTAYRAPRVGSPGGNRGARAPLARSA